MKFRITRTSQKSFATEPPCEGCARETISGRNSYGNPWAMDIWVREVETLGDLIALQKETGHELVVCVEGGHYDMPEIEIYDDYRE